MYRFSGKNLSVLSSVLIGAFCLQVRAELPATFKDVASSEIAAKNKKLYDTVGTYQEMSYKANEELRTSAQEMADANAELAAFKKKYEKEYVYSQTDSRTGQKTEGKFLDNRVDQMKFKAQYGEEEYSRYFELRDRAAKAQVKNFNPLTRAYNNVAVAYADTRVGSATKDLAKNNEGNAALNARIKELEDAFQATVLKAKADDIYVQNLKTQQEFKDQFDLLSRNLDNAKMGLYVQEKIGLLLVSNAFCDAAKACAAGGDRKLKGDALKEIFPYAKPETLLKDRSTGTLQNGQQ